MEGACKSSRSRYSYSYSCILDSKSNKQAFKKLFQQRIILAEPFDASQKYCLMHTSKGIALLEKADWVVQQRFCKIHLQFGILHTRSGQKKPLLHASAYSSHCFSEATCSVRE